MRKKANEEYDDSALSNTSLPPTPAVCPRTAHKISLPSRPFALRGGGWIRAEWNLCRSGHSAAPFVASPHSDYWQNV